MVVMDQQKSSSRKASSDNSLTRTTLQDENQLRRSNSKMSNRDLHQSLNDALEKNYLWQSYNAEREAYVSTLLQKFNEMANEIQSLRNKMMDLSKNPDELAIEQRRHFDKILVDAKNEIQNQQDQLKKLTERNEALTTSLSREVEGVKSELNHWKRKYNKQQEAMAHLNDVYKAEKRSNKEKQSQIKLLQKQIQILFEDFCYERRERAQLEKEIDYITRELAEFDAIEQKLGMRRVSGVVKSVRKRKEHVTDRELQSTTTKAAAKNNLTLAGWLESTQGELKKSSGKAKSSNRKERKPRSRVVTPASSRISSGVDSELFCPICNKKYDVSDHALLVAHIDECG